MRRRGDCYRDTLEIRSRCESPSHLARPRHRGCSNLRGGEKPGAAPAPGVPRPAAAAAPGVPGAGAAAAPRVPAHHTLSPEPHTGHRFLAKKTIDAEFPFSPPARHREAERRDPPPRPAARVRAWASGRGRGGALAAGAPRHPAFLRAGGGCAPRRACERRAAAAGWQVALAAATFARLRTLDWTLVL